MSNPFAGFLRIWKNEGFISIARSEFAFLRREHGFGVTKKVDSELETVRFDRKGVSVSLFYDKCSWEIDVDLERAPETKLTLYEVLLVVAPASAPRASMRAGNPEAFRRCLGEAADLVREHCIPILLGDWEKFERVADGVARVRHEYTQRFTGAIKE